MLALVLAGLLAIMAPNAFADADNLSLNATIIDAPDKGWYGSGDIVELTASLANDGEATSIVVDPSCDEVLRVWSQSVLVYEEQKHASTKAEAWISMHSRLLVSIH